MSTDKFIPSLDGLCLWRNHSKYKAHTSSFIMREALKPVSNGVIFYNETKYPFVYSNTYIPSLLFHWLKLVNMIKWSEYLKFDGDFKLTLKKYHWAEDTQTHMNKTSGKIIWNLGRGKTAPPPPPPPPKCEWNMIKTKIRSYSKF